MESIADKEVEHIYDSLVKDLDDGMLYGKRIGDFEDKMKAYVVAAYFKGMFPQSDPTQHYPATPIFEYKKKREIDTIDCGYLDAGGEI